LILHNGILGKGTKKIGNIVGANWKNRNYVRSYVIPANPNSDLQKAQRARFAANVEFVKGILGQIIQPYVDPFQRAMSGYNYFIKQNIMNFEDPLVYTGISVTWGQLYKPSFVSAIWNSTPTYHCDLTWGTELGQNGKATDSVYAAVWDYHLKLWFFPTAAVARSVGTIAIPLNSDTIRTDCTVFWFSYRLKNLICTMVSDSQTHVLASS
jgi:hypothetical protein